jgi:ABC-type phosphate transport system permease subunit
MSDMQIKGASSSPSPIEPSTATKAHLSAEKSRLLSGYSILTRGEPYIWLSGGMMTVCIAMMIGLLSLIIYNGSATFWPAKFVVAPMRDGSLTMGEVSGSSSYFLSSQQVSQMGPASAAYASELLDGADSVVSNRTYLRTGNFDLTGRHYSYISEVEADLSAMVEPPYAWVVERTSDGRFYGIPLVFRERFMPPPMSGASNVGSAQAVELYRNAVAEFGSAAESTESVADRLASLGIEEKAVEWATTERLRFMTEWLVQRSTADCWYENSEGNWSPIDQGSINPEVISLTTPVIENRVGPNVVESELKQTKPRIGELNIERDALRDSISEVDRRKANKRLAIRQAELDYDVQLPISVTSLLEPWLAKSAEESRRDQIVSGLQAVRSARRWSREEESAINDLVSAVQSSFDTLLKEFDSQIEDQQTKLADLPKPVIDVVEACLNAWYELSPEQNRQSRRLTELEERLDRWSITYATSELGDEIRLQKESLPNTGESFGWTLSQAASTDGGGADPKNANVRTASLVNKTDLGKAGEIVLAESVTADQPANALVMYFTDGVANSANNENNNSESDRRDSGNRNRVGHLLKTHAFPVANIVRHYRPDNLSLAGKWAVYGSRWWEFVSDNPREANTEGGFFPAIWGTVVMTLIMTIVVVPFGVMAALYLREYTKSGWLVSTIRICINNLAGVPSIVYGVFGLAFFCYVVGGYVDGGPSEAGVTPWPPATWFAALAVVAVLALICFSIFITCSGPQNRLSKTQKRLKRSSMILWLLCLAGVLVLLAKTPFFDGFYRASMPNPTFSKGGLLWASLTLALLTLPVVIVATEEALSAVPNSLREGSYACGASKWQTIQRIVLPHARPGILTGSILAMARGAGEVAPLMLVGALPVAIDLPLDAEFPFFHGSRSFMHLGFQIFSLGFQSQNSEAAKPMVYTATLLLIAIVALLNLAAIWLRSRLKKQFVGSQF